MNGEDAVNTVHSPIQDMRVDNWGNYCLQRLHSMHEKGELCDLTIQFHTNQILKVHRVVMNLCTEYFSELERTVGLTSGMLVLPEEIEYQALSTIIKFFYTGRLEVRGNQFNEIHKTVRLLNVSILLKLLEAHSRKPVQPKPDTISPPAVNIKSERFEGVNTVCAAHGARVLKPNAGQTLVRPLRQGQGLATKTVLAKVQPHQIGKRLGPAILTNATNGKHVFKKKLPIWKERKFSPVANIKTEPQKWSDEPARPTRFEWPEMDEDGQHGTAKSNKETRSETRENIFDVIKTQTNSAAPANESKKCGTSSGSLPPPEASSTIDDPIERELAEMEKPDDEVSDQPITAPSDVSCADTSGSTPSTEAEGQMQADPDCQSEETHVVVVAECEKNEQDLSLPECGNGAAVVTTGRTPDPSDASENDDLRIVEEIADPIPIDCHDIKSDPENPMSHSRIISEVFKMYPDLAKDHRNIKLKIVQKNSPKKLEKVKEPRSKVSYIILKSTSSSDCLASPLLAKKTTRLNKRALNTTSTFWDPPNKVAKPVATPAENLEGPWICERCSTETDTTEFDSYFNYRKHLVEVHADRIDARICEHCGYKASKRNLLLYHLYTKHAIQPRNCSFPHCDQCSYVGLTESLLNKHKVIHLSSGKYICQGCKTHFASAALLNMHMRQNVNCNSKFNCSFCLKGFSKDANLKAHLLTVHRKKVEEPVKLHVSASEPEDDFSDCTILVQDDPLQIEAESTDQEIEYHESIQVSESQNPSSEAEALTNVASSIAASLGLEAGQHFTTAESNPHDPLNQQHTIYILEDSSATTAQDGLVEAVEGNLQSITHEVSGLEVTDPQVAGSFIVQDEDGNKFEQVTTYDEYGKQIVYFQLAQEHQHYPLEEEPDEEDVQHVETVTIEEEEDQQVVEQEQTQDSSVEVETTSS